MKKILLTLLSITLLTSCYDEGEIVKTPKSIYEINGKRYKFVKISPSAIDHPVWIMIPLDTLQDAPQVIATQQSDDKNTKFTSTIIIK
jgi:hypothetical protein